MSEIEQLRMLAASMTPSKAETEAALTHLVRTRRRRSITRRGRIVAVVALAAVSVVVASRSLWASDAPDAETVEAAVDDETQQDLPAPTVPQSPTTSAVGGRVVDLTVLVVDEGDGPRGCLWGYDTTLPPSNCHGPTLSGSLDGVDLTETLGPVRWGEVRLRVEWPADGEQLVVLGPGVDAPDVDHTRRPADCAGASRADNHKLSDYIHSEPGPDGFSGAWVATDGLLVANFVGDLELHADAIGVDEVCLQPARFTERELLAIQDDLLAVVVEPDSPALYTVPNGPEGRIRVGVWVADERTVAAILDAAGEPEAISIEELATTVAVP